MDTGDRWRRIEELFHAALDLPPAERDAYLQQSCGPDTELRKEVHSLLQSAEESIDFLGYTIGRCYSRRSGRAYIGTRPSAKGVRAICAEISEMTQKGTYRKPAEAIVGEINRKLRGWGNYFCLGAVTQAYRVVDNHTRHRLRQWLNAKHRSRGVQPVRHPAAYLHEKLGLYRLESSTQNHPWAKA